MWPAPGREMDAAVLREALTDKGRELFPVLIALMQWDDRWLADRARPPVLVRHAGDCGAPVHAEVVCSAAHRPLTARDTAVAKGKSARRRIQRHPERARVRR